MLGIERWRDGSRGRVEAVREKQRVACSEDLSEQNPI